MPGRVARPRMRPIAARCKTRPVWTRAFWGRQPEAPAPWLVTVGTGVGIAASILTTYMLLRGFIANGNTMLTIKLETISKDVAALSADVRAQQNQVSVMQGKVELLERWSAPPTKK